MGMMRHRGFMAAVAMCAILAMYFGLVAVRAAAFVRTGEPLAVGIGIGLLVLPVLGVWWMFQEWRLGTTVQRMADQLEMQDRLPVVDPELVGPGRLRDEVAAKIYEDAKLELDARPEDWAAWFNVAFAYEAGRDRKQARKALRHAAHLYRLAERV